MAHTGFLVQGAKEFEAKLRKMPSRVRNGIVSKVLRPAARVTVVAAKVNLRSTRDEQTGNLRKSIGVVFRKYRNGTLRVAVIGPRMTKVNKKTGKKSPGGSHGMWMEFGTVERFGRAPGTGTIGSIAKAVRGVGAISRGRISPKPFLRPAFHANRGKMRALMQKGLKETIEKAATRK